MDILFPDIHMLMLMTPWSCDPATEDIQDQTSSKLASAPGWAGADVVVVAIPATRATQQPSSNKGIILILVMVLVMCFLLGKTQSGTYGVMRRLYI